MFFEVRDVGSGGEGLAAGTRKDDGPNIPLRAQFPDQLSHVTPHAEADGVALGRAVDSDRGHGRLTVHKNLVVLIVQIVQCG
jgi:hypothetical protein